jgi:hypothetical protein
VLARADLNTALPPAGNFDLRHWKLTLPVDAAGQTSGLAAEIQPQQLTAVPAYSSEWFYTESDGSMSFWAPHQGATTANAKYPRSELREMVDPEDDNVNWTVFDPSVLIAICKVTQVPGTGKVVVGQIHSKGGAGPLVKLQYEYSSSTRTGKVFAVVNRVPNPAAPDKYLLASGIKLGARFSYQIRVSHNGGNGVLSAVVGSGTSISIPIDHAWDTWELYFKAGSYVQEAGTTSTIGAAVDFHVLAATHPRNGLKITTQALPDAAAGAYYQRNLTAAGGSGGYRWSLVSGVLPQGMVLDADGTLRGTPALSEASNTAHTLTVLLTDVENSTAARALNLTIR